MWKILRENLVPIERDQFCRGKTFKGGPRWKRESLIVTVVIALTSLIFFHRNLLGKAYTGWDTYYGGFMSFLYFSDSLWNGSLPLWNHFIQSGTFFPSFNNIGLFSPFQLVFVLLSWVISPLYAYELMVQAVILVGGVGGYLLFRSFGSDRLIALFGVTAFLLSTQMPIVGQLGFLFSLSSFPWLIFACIKIADEHNERLFTRYIFLGTLGALYTASGYLWMNLINLLITAFFLAGLYYKRSANWGSARRIIIGNLAVFFGAYILLYVGLEIPGLQNTHFNYDLFSGDYLSPEPRLRSLDASRMEIFSYGSIYSALIGAIDPRLLANKMWSIGAGWVVVLILLFARWKKHFSALQAFFAVMLGVSILYMAGPGTFFGKVVKHIPIINANRWWMLGAFYANIALVSLAVLKLTSFTNGSERVKSHNIRSVIIGCLLLSLLVLIGAPVIEFALVAIAGALIWCLGSGGQRRRDWVLWCLMVVNIVAFASMGKSFWVHTSQTDMVSGYAAQTASHNSQIAITKNYRRLGKNTTYIWSDEQWLWQKVPFSHGYNNMGNPLYWYVKDEAFLEWLVFVTQDVRRERELGRKNFPSDNEFAKAMMGDVLADTSRPTIEGTHFRNLLLRPRFQWKLNELNVEPNTARMRVATDAAAFLIFNNVHYPGWKAYVNGKKAELVRTNRIFQGVFLEGAGDYDVVFKFRPVATIALILLPYIVLSVCLIAYIQTARRKSGAGGG